ncbi:unnamed protein product, partial [Didymodactylos carnosus]
MAVTLLKVLIRLKNGKYHRTEIRDKQRILDLYKQIANELHLTIGQVKLLTIYRNTANSIQLLYPLSYDMYLDESRTLDTFAILQNEELYLDINELFDDLTLSTSPSSTVSSTSSVIINESNLSPSVANFQHYQSKPKKLSFDQQQHKTSSSTSTISISKTLKSSVGQLVRYSVPADNSCLFSSIYFVLHSGKMDLTSNKHLRDIIATTIESDEKTYSEAILGRKNSDYCKWIRKDDSWGGGIELAILTKLYEIEICVINSECGGRIDYFGEDCQFLYRVFLLYDGLHYDPVYYSKFDPDENEDLIQTKFLRNDETILNLAKKLIESTASSATLTTYNIEKNGTDCDYRKTMKMNELMHVKL